MPDVTTKHFQNIPFEAQLAYDNPLYASLLYINGAYGFAISDDPLYKVTIKIAWIILFKIKKIFNDIIY